MISCGYPRNDGFCVKNDGFCIKNDGFCILKKDEFRKEFTDSRHVSSDSLDLWQEGNNATSATITELLQAQGSFTSMLEFLTTTRLPGMFAVCCSTCLVYYAMFSERLRASTGSFFADALYLTPRGDTKYCATCNRNANYVLNFPVEMQTDFGVAPDERFQSS